MSNIEINRQTPNITISEPRADYHLPIASETTLGGIKVGSNLTITTDGILSAESTEYTLPAASATTLGGIKVGSNLSIFDSVLSANVDSTLSASSNNPVKNSTIYSTVGGLSHDISELDTRVTNAENNISNLTETQTTQGNTLTTLSNNYTSLSNDVSTNTNNIATNTNAISSLNDTYDTLSGDLSDLSDTVTDQGNAINEMGGEIEDFTLSSDTDVTYSYILPASTWTQGKITYSRRGKIGLITFDLVGSMTLASGVDIQIYQLPDTFQNSIVTQGTLNTNLGPITVKIDANRNITFYNETSSSMSQILRVAGQLVVVLE